MKMDLRIFVGRFWKRLDGKVWDRGFDRKFPTGHTGAEQFGKLPVAPQAGSGPVRNGDRQVQAVCDTVYGAVKPDRVLYQISQKSLSFIKK